MQELGEFNFKMNVIPNRLEKYMSFNINNKLIFIDSFQFLSSSLDSLVKNLKRLLRILCVFGAKKLYKLNITKILKDLLRAI